MPTKKRRLGFIPRSEVLDLINKISYESNLSYSKIINILVEEALFNRGMLNKFTRKDNEKNYCNFNENSIQENIRNIKNEFTSNFKNKLLEDEKINTSYVRKETLDSEIYEKFIMFLQFQERMKKKDL